MIAVSGGEIALMAAFGGVVLVSLAAVVATAVGGMGRLPESPADDGRAEHVAMRSAARRRDRSTLPLLVVTFAGLSGLTAALLVWGDGLDLWAYAIMVGGIVLCWLLAVVTISNTRASPEA